MLSDDILCQNKEQYYRKVQFSRELNIQESLSDTSRLYKFTQNDREEGEIVEEMNKFVQIMFADAPFKCKSTNPAPPVTDNIRYNTTTKRTNECENMIQLQYKNSTETPTSSNQYG